MGNKKSGVKADNSEKTIEPPPAKTSKKPTEEDVLAIMQKLKNNGVIEVTSRLLSDKLGLEPDAGRQKVRALMKKLEKVGKVEISEKMKGERKQYTYELVKKK